MSSPTRTEVTSAILMAWASCNRIRPARGSTVRADLYGRGDGNRGARLGGEFLIERRFQAPITNRIVRKAAEARRPRGSAEATNPGAYRAGVAPLTQAPMRVGMTA